MIQSRPWSTLLLVPLMAVIAWAILYIRHAPPATVHAQSASVDCSFTATFTGAGNLGPIDNRPSAHPCVAWRVTYSTTGTLQAAIAFQTSPDNSSYTSVPNTVCSPTVQPPCVSEGANPTAAGRTGNVAVRAYDAWVR